MDLKLNNLDNCRREFSAELNYDELQPHFEKALLDYRKKVVIPGFRKGKAPLSMIRKLYYDSIEYSALEGIANDVFLKYISDNNLNLFDRGELKDIDYKPEEKLNFKIEFEVIPDLVLKDLKEIELTVDKFIVNDEMVEDEIKNIRLNNAQYEVDGQALDDEYRITIDTQALDKNGNVIIGDTTKDFKIYLGNKEIFPEFKEGFKNIKENEEKVIETTDSKGNPKKVKIICTKVEKIIYPELNEEFFRKTTGRDIKTIDEFKSIIRNEIEKYYEKMSSRKLENDIVNELIKQNDIAVPEKFVDRIIDNYWEEHNKTGKKHKHTREDEEKFKKERRVDAILQAKWYLIKEKLVEEQKLEVTEEDYIIFAEKNIKDYNLPLPVDKLVETYKENKDIRYQILENKINAYLKNNIKIMYTDKDLSGKSNSKIIS